MKARKTICSAVVLAATIAVTACSGPGKDVEFYKAHVDQRDQVIAKCRKDVARSKDDHDCVNAAQALFEGDGLKHTPGKKY
ncbi:EexN family lipoprotein [Xanthomonas arboricola pv. juglandis]|uniref:EexN family lipoprotein n=1 Tax=Xanthomonas TaxID=338 RepID=UPI0015F28FFE|nr:EexN family lipoprotein [Xanthomonas arboricola]CAG2090685.1 EexN family lipoprotein [Xanthomonas arboricola pv. juglandis]